MVRFCCNFKRDHEYMDLIDEINITPINESIIDLKAFLEKHQKQRVNLCVNIDRDYNINIVKDLVALPNKDNLYVRLRREFFTTHDDILDFLKENHIPYYFDIIVDNWDTFNGVAAAGVSDIYIGNEFGFQLKDIHAKAAARNIKIRVYPNVAQSSWSKTDGVTKFFVRPEDAMFYSDYVDCFEFYEVQNSSLTNTEVLYDIYKFDKEWNGDLKAIILFLNDDVDNKLIDNDFWASSRINCRKNCASVGLCQMCYRLSDIANNMSEKEQQFHKLLTK